MAISGGGKIEHRRNTRACPWQNYPTHRRNHQIQVHGDLPLTYGYCPQELECASCAGTLYKPNVLLEQGRPFVFVECPCCEPAAYRKRVDRLKALLPKGAGPISTPITRKEEQEAFERRQAEARARRRQRPKPKPTGTP